MKVIADIGVNHKGSFNIARQLVEACADIGVDYVKFQMFFEVFPELPQLTQDETLNLIEICKTLNLKWFATCFDVTAMKLCRDENMEIWKIPSGLSMNRGYCDAVVDHMGDAGNKLFVSTGISNDAECVVTHDYLWYPHAYDLVMFNCVSDYPAKSRDMNLNMINACWLNGEAIGLSDHSRVMTPARLAQAMGYAYLEKHITLPGDDAGIDAEASFTPFKFKILMTVLKSDRDILGSNIKPNFNDAKRIDILKRMDEVHRNIDKHKVI